MPRMGHVALFVSDLARARAFYEDVLDMRHSETHGPDDHGMLGTFGQTVCFLSFGEQHHDVVLVYQTDESGAAVPVEGHTLMHLAFALEDGMTTASFAERLEEKGVPIVYGPVRHTAAPEGDGTWGGNRSVYFQDPDGHLLEGYTEMEPYTGDRQAVGAEAAG